MSTEDKHWDNNDEVSGGEEEQEVIDPPGFIKEQPPKLDRRKLTSKENMRKAQTLRAQRAREQKEAAEKLKQMYYDVHQDEDDDFEQVEGEEYDQDTMRAVKQYLKEEKRKEQKGKGKQRYPESESDYESEEDSAEEYVITKKSSKPKVPKPTYKPKKVQKEQSFADYMKYMNPLLLMSKLSTKEAKKQREEVKKEEKIEPAPRPVNPMASELKRKIIDM